MEPNLQSATNLPPAHEVLVPENDTVVVDGVAPTLMLFAVQLAYLHFILFGAPLVITSGRDGVHNPGSLHPEGRALDFKTHDKSGEEMVVFLAILAFAAPRNNCRVFDERVGPGGEHLHVEYHG